MIKRFLHILIISAMLFSIIFMISCNECGADIDYSPDESGFMNPCEREKLAKKTVSDYCEEHEIEKYYTLRDSYMYYLDDEDTGYLYVFCLKQAGDSLRVIVTADGDKAYIE